MGYKGGKVMLFISVTKKEFAIAFLLVVLFVGSFIVMQSLPSKPDSIPVVALDEYLIHEGTYYQRTLSVVALIDKKLIPTNTFYQGRPLYKESKTLIPPRLFWPIDLELYTVFIKLED